MSLRYIQTGELPPVAVDRKFSFSKWNKGDKGKHPILSATSKGYRAQKARVLWKKIQTGALTGAGREAVLRDYAKEFKRMGVVK